MMRTVLASAAALCFVAAARAEVPEATVTSLGAPDRVETAIGTLTFKDGVPDADTAAKVYDAMDFANALAVYNNSFRGASAYAISAGLRGAVGAKDNDVVIFSELMDASSLFLTANADTVYYLAAIDLTHGPMVIEQPSDAVGTINDMWFSWIIDIGGPGPDRGLGGKYLIVPPGYDGPLPEGGYFVAHSKTNRVLYASRAYLVDNDPKPAVENIKANMKIYPYVPGGYGTSIAQALEGKVRLGGEPKVPEMKFVEGTGASVNTIPPSDFGFFEMINANVQDGARHQLRRRSSPASSPPSASSRARPFAPDERMKKILDRRRRGRQRRRPGAATGASRKRIPTGPTIPARSGATCSGKAAPSSRPRRPPSRTACSSRCPRPAPARWIRARRSTTATRSNSPGMIMNIPDVGSQYLMGFLDPDGEPFDGAKTYKVTLPKDIPARGLLVVHALRQPDPLDAADAAEIPARRQPELSLARRRGGRGRLDYGLVRARAARGRRARQLDPDRPGEGLVHPPPPLQPAAVVLHQGVAAWRDRTGRIEKPGRDGRGPAARRRPHV